MVSAPPTAHPGHPAPPHLQAGDARVPGGGARGTKDEVEVGKRREESQEEKEGVEAEKSRDESPEEEMEAWWLIGRAVSGSPVGLAVHYVHQKLRSEELPAADLAAPDTEAMRLKRDHVPGWLGASGRRPLLMPVARCDVLRRRSSDAPSGAQKPLKM